MKANKMELLSPAGTWESLRAAIQAGANAVYFGVGALNMRAKNNMNFEAEDIPEIVRVCREAGVKTYLTLNTILYDHDLVMAKRIIAVAKEQGIDAIIAFDQSAIMYAREAGIPVHISTQANVTNVGAVKFYSAFADLMVLSRELTLDQVKQIATAIQREKITGPSGELVKLEVFCHGALCMAVSGKCYLSLHTNFASANRGACVQNCRKSYTVRDTETGTEFEIENEYIMSAKDLCTIGFLNRIVDAGVSVIKIEGRGRSEEYVYTVTKCYREALDAIADGTYTPEKVEAWKEQLGTVFNRGFFDGYYLGRTDGEWHDKDGSAATKKKIYLGKANHYYDRAGVAEVVLEAGAVSVGDEIMFSGKTTGVVFSTVEEIRFNEQPTESAVKGQLITIPVPVKVRSSDKLYKIIDRAENHTLQE